MSRDKIHKPYYSIPAYQILAKLSDLEMAEALGITVRTYKDKINGISDFSASEGKMLSALLNVSQDQLFLN